MHKETDALKIAKSVDSIEFQWNGERYNFPLKKGFDQLYQLLANPFTEISCVILHTDNPERILQSSPLYDEESVRKLHNAPPDPIADHKYINDAKTELNRLIQLKATYTDYNDPLMIEDTQTKIDELTDALQKIYNVHNGKVKEFPTTFTDCKEAVMKSIRRALAEIGKKSEKLAAHLKSRIRLGLYCCYTPNTDVVVKMAQHQKTSNNDDFKRGKPW